MYRYILTGFAAVLILAAGYVHGTVTQRWQPAELLTQAASRLKTLPTSIGEWESKDIEMNKKHLQVAEVEGYVSRQYYHKKSGERLSFLLICGKPGPIAVHSPDVCYEGAGYKMGPRTSQALLVADKPNNFWTARFTKDSDPTPLQIAWSWSAGGTWVAADYPRLAFYRAAVLYKWYVIREVTDTNTPSIIDETTQAFIREVIPQIKVVLNPQ